MHIEVLQHLRDEIVQAHRPWTEAMRERLRNDRKDDLMPMLEALGAELEQAVEWRKAFLERPVTTPAGIELDIELAEAVLNLSEGKSPFGLKGLFGKSAQKKHLDSIRVLGNLPADTESWKHVAEHLALLKRLRELALRWNVLANELQLEVVPGDRPESGLTAAQEYALYLKVKDVVKAEGELCITASHVFPNWAHVREVADNTQRLVDLEKALRHHLTKNKLANVWAAKERFQKVLEGRTGRVIKDLRRFLSEILGNPEIEDARMQSEWSALMAELSRVLGLGTHLTAVCHVCDKIEASGALQYATSLKQPLEGTVDGLLLDNWRKAWRLRRLATYLESIDAQEELKRLAKDRQEVESDLSRAYRDIVVKRTWLKLAENASPSIRAALQAYLNAIQKIGKGTGKRAVRYRQDARMAASQANPAVPCWIMSHYRVSESLPAELGCFDLVVIDEASQSDLTALPSLLRAQKVLIVGDDKQVSPEGVGLEEEKIRSLMSRFLGNQVETYRPQMAPTSSIYDLFKVVFAKSAVMLKEHFRCVGPIIEYSKREFYNHELRPLRMPKASERLDPPLIDVVVEDGFRRGDVNLPEARFIIDEIKAIVADPNMGGRSIGVVSLLADKQALLIWERLTDELGPEVMQRHRIACGDARTFQGKERDIMFLSMVSAPNEIGAPLSRDTFAQRFNVAASRARDRMYLVRSVALEHLSEADRLRRSLIAHFATPFTQDEMRVEDLRKLCESPFEREMYDELTQRGYWVTPQVRVGQYRIDMVMEGHNDARLAVECDGDKYHGEDKWADDMQRQRVLERAGWVFLRCFASAFIRRRKDMLDDLLKTLAERGIEPIGAEGAPRSVHTEHRVVSFADEPISQTDSTPAESPEGAQASTPAVRTALSSPASEIVPPIAQDKMRTEDLRNRCKSPFERELYRELTQRGYRVTPQVSVGQYRIDMVVEGDNDARLAIECDGDMQRQRVLEHAGWVFWRISASAFVSRRKEIMDDLLKTLAERGIKPIGAEGAPKNVHTGCRVVRSVTEPANNGNLMPVDVPGLAQASTPAEPPEPESSARVNVLSVQDHLHQSPANGELFGRRGVLVRPVKSPDATLPLWHKIDLTEQEQRVQALIRAKLPHHRSFATQKMTTYIAQNQFFIEFQDGALASWALPDAKDKAAIKAVLDNAVRFAREHGASIGQMNAVRKKLTDEDYHLTK